MGIISRLFMVISSLENNAGLKLKGVRLFLDCHNELGSRTQDMVVPIRQLKQHAQIGSTAGLALAAQKHGLALMQSSRTDQCPSHECKQVHAGKTPSRRQHM